MSWHSACHNRGGFGF